MMNFIAQILPFAILMIAFFLIVKGGSSRSNPSMSGGVGRESRDHDEQEKR